MSRPLMREDYLMIGGVIFVIFICVIFLVRSYIYAFRNVRRRHSASFLAARENLGQVHGPYRRTRARESTLDLHQATGIDRHHGASAGAQD